jgi:nitroreductase
MRPLPGPADEILLRCIEMALRAPTGSNAQNWEWAVQNFLLACRAEGLGAALTTLPVWWMTLARRALDLPFNVQPCAVIPVGWPRGR